MTVRILTGDARSVLASLPSESVHACVTSPPYFGLRSYLPDGHPDKAKEIGLEPTPAAFVAEMVTVFREVRRVLRSDGTLWLNLGDSYCGSPPGTKRGVSASSTLAGVNSERYQQTLEQSVGTVRDKSKLPGLKPKDLIGIPWMVAFALRSDGWWLRSDNIWAKANGMPESTRDRPTRAHEYVFEFSKSQAYYYAYEDVRLPPVPESVSRLARAMRAQLDGPDDPEAGSLVVSGGGYAPPGQPPHKGARRSDKQRGHTRRHAGFNDRWDAKEKAQQQADGAALRSVWWISPGGFPDAHFAVMPEEVAATAIVAGCPRGGVVLDPFGGAGTTGLVADRLGRDAILIELNPEYAAMAERRIKADGVLLSDVRLESPLPTEATGAPG